MSLAVLKSFCTSMEVSGTFFSGFAKSGFGLFRVSTRSGFFVFYRVSGSSSSLKIRAVSGTRDDVQIRCPNFQNHTKAIFQHFRGTKSKVMKRTSKIMIKSVFKMIRMSQKCQKSLAWSTRRVPLGFHLGFRVVEGFCIFQFFGFRVVKKPDPTCRVPDF